MAARESVENEEDQDWVILCFAPRARSWREVIVAHCAGWARTKILDSPERSAFDNFDLFSAANDSCDTRAWSWRDIAMNAVQSHRQTG